MEQATKIGHVAVEIDALGTDVLAVAYDAAKAVASPATITRGGWVGLCKVQGSTSDPYKVSIRKVKSDRGFQFGCGCRQWIYRCNKAGTLCKHQKAFLAEAVNNPGKFWMYEAGVAFAQAVSDAIAPMVQAAIHGHDADEKAA